jgi:hypothetical protein
VGKGKATSGEHSDTFPLATVLASTDGFELETGSRIWYIIIERYLKVQ